MFLRASKIYFGPFNVFWDELSLVYCFFRVLQGVLRVSLVLYGFSEFLTVSLMVFKILHDL